MVIIVGGGWSGLAAAVELTSSGIPVTLFESAPCLGGRARVIQVHGASFDNGQHLIIGAYRELLRLLALMGVSESTVFARHPLKLRMYQRRGPGFRPMLRMTVPHLPAPLHMLAAIIAAKGLTARDRLRALGLCMTIAKPKPLDPDQTVSTFLSAQGQSTVLMDALWGPLCLAIMNTAPETASAKIFIQVLRDTFVHRRADSDLLLIQGSIDQVFIKPALAYIRDHGGSVQTGQRVTGLRVNHHGVCGVDLINGATMATDRLILALPPPELSRLLKGHAASSALASRLDGITYEPICTVYLQYPPEIHLDQAMIGLVGTLTQWLFDRGYGGEPGLMAAVVSASGPHMAMSRIELADQVQQEIASCFPSWPAPRSSITVREKRATFSCCVDINQLRPDHASGLPGCLLAGDSSYLPYPATLEGAIRSGVACAQRIQDE